MLCIMILAPLMHCILFPNWSIILSFLWSGLPKHGGAPPWLWRQHGACGWEGHQASRQGHRLWERSHRHHVPQVNTDLILINTLSVWEELDIVIVMLWFSCTLSTDLSTHQNTNFLRWILTNFWSVSVWEELDIAIVMLWFSCTLSTYLPITSKH